MAAPFIWGIYSALHSHANHHSFLCIWLNSFIYVNCKVLVGIGLQKHCGVKCIFLCTKDTIPCTIKDFLDWEAGGLNSYIHFVANSLYDFGQVSRFPICLGKSLAGDQLLSKGPVTYLFLFLDFTTALESQHMYCHVFLRIECQ